MCWFYKQQLLIFVVEFYWMHKRNIWLNKAGDRKIECRGRAGISRHMQNQMVPGLADCSATTQGPHTHFHPRDCKNSLSCGVESAFTWHVLLKTLWMPLKCIGGRYLTSNCRRLAMPKSIKKSKEPTCINTNVGSVVKLVRQTLEQCGSDGCAGFKVLSAQAKLVSALVKTSKTDTCICALLKLCWNNFL